MTDTVTRIPASEEPGVHDQSALLRPVLSGAMYLGGVFQATYDRFMVIATDHQKEACGGVPRGGLLLATGINDLGISVGDYGADDEVVLLRVLDNAALPNESDLLQMRADAIEDAATGRFLDQFSKAKTERCAFLCTVLGTFYPGTTPKGTPALRWGSDVDTTYAGAHYFVYVPGPEALSYIASFPPYTDAEIDGAERGLRIRLGAVRCASTRRRAQKAGLADAMVNVRVSDFISRKTAVLGMTRAGKSNTIKTICTVVFEHARRTDQRIGQIIFDPQGEYANPNEQDGTALRLLGDRWIRIYKIGADPTKSDERELGYNFFDPNNAEIVHEVCAGALSSIGGQYAAPFLSTNFSPLPPDAEPQDRNERGRALFALYAILAQAGFALPSDWRGLPVQMAGKLVAAIREKHPKALVVTKNPQFPVVKTTDGLIDAMGFICTAVEEYQSKGKRFPDDSKYRGLEDVIESWARDEKAFGQVRQVFQLRGGRPAASKALERIREFHSTSATGQVEQKIIEDLTDGRIVIVDLSHGSERVGKIMADRIAEALLAHANDEFCEGGKTMPIQVVLEEAHRIFDREHYRAERPDPWVQIAKEAAKYEIGLMYATQEVTSVDSRILSQTNNWVVAHLNSSKETGELGHYYDFADFAADLRRCEDVGYVRLKTLSSPYTLSVQVDKFDHAMINRARTSAGLKPIAAPNAAKSASAVFGDEVF